MNRYSISVILLLLCNNAGAVDVCAGWVRIIEPDMQIRSEDFTLESYDKALDRLKDLGREDQTMLVRFAQQNSLKFVSGWLLKKAAIKALESEPPVADSPEVKAFCEFLTEDAFYHD